MIYEVDPPRKGQLTYIKAISHHLPTNLQLRYFWFQFKRLKQKPANKTYASLANIHHRGQASSSFFSADSPSFYARTILLPLVRLQAPKKRLQLNHHHHLN